ncbi:MAG: type II toxin-antitoxin system VapC family toxin [Acidimicrobiia bacterium]
MVDTNVLVYAADAEAPEHETCRFALEGWRLDRTPWYVTWGIVYEFLRVVTHPRVLRSPFDKKGAFRFVEAVLASPSAHILTETSRHLEVLAQVVDEVPLLTGNLYHDAHTAVLMREHGVRSIVTRDTDFHRFGFLDVIDPLQ